MKVRKVFGIETTDYLDGFQYTDSVLKFFPTAEGYFNVETGKYVYNYTDHLGNVRLSYAKNGAGTEIIEESNYYPFGLKHEGYNVLTGNSAYKYKYNGKELQESGMYDYGARFYIPDLGRWGVVDPLAEKMTRHSPYNYAFNNPSRFTDPDGRKGTDVIIKGGAKQAALDELQKSVSSELTLKMNSNGKVSYTQNNAGAKLSNDAQQLVNAIDDHSVNVNLTAEYTKKTSDGYPYVLGAFGGSETKYLLSTDGKSLNPITETRQEINPAIAKRVSAFFWRPGADTLHEVTESYQGALAARALGKLSVGIATNAEGDNPFSVYNIAYNSATSQTDGYDISAKRSDGSSANPFSKGAITQVFLKDTTGKKPNELIYIYP
ncbi:RHS repeat-associated core domain-containing protein [Chryseobacterium sp. IT-36CA2]|uniref:RHS repeat-associated core domain-containing protein n=1 Tax=Chryseobacterium sp. IT-36CA2 TaxID=3026460 RepID=UPI0039DF6DE5